MQPVRIEMLGQSCMAIRTGKHEIVTDPWCSGLAQLGAWRAYPELDHAALGRLRTRIDQATHIFIANDRSDHFDPAFLASLSPKLLIASDFRNARFRKRLDQLVAYGHSLRLLSPDEALELDGRASVRIVPEQPRFRSGSMLLVHTPFGSLLDANSCSLDPAALRVITERARVRVFAHSLNFVAGSLAHLRSDAPGLRAELDAVRDRKVNNYRNALRVLQPDLGLVIGGPVTFTDAINAHLNAHPEALDWSAMVARLDGDSCVLWPGPSSVFELGDDGVAPLELLDFESVLHSSAPPSAPLSSPTALPEAAPAAAEIDRAAAAFTARIGALLDLLSLRSGVPLYLAAVPDLAALEAREFAFSLRIELDRDTRGVTRVDPVMPQPPFLHIASTAAILRGFLAGEITFDELLLSARARFSRDPDVFDPVLHDMLRYSHDPDASAALVDSLYRERKGEPERRPSSAG